MHSDVEIPVFLQAIGVVAYSIFTILAITWGGIAVDRAKRLARENYLLAIACVCAALFAANLTLIATEPTWVSRIVLTVFNRATVLIGVIALAVYTVAVLRAEYIRDQTVRRNKNASSHSNTLTAL